MTPRELNEEKLEKAVGGNTIIKKTVPQERKEAVDRQILEGFIQCKNCGKKEKEMFKRHDTDPQGVELECFRCGFKLFYKWQDISIG